MAEDLVLVEVKSNGERNVYKDADVSIPTTLSLNGRIFVAPKDHLDSLVRFHFHYPAQHPHTPAEHK
jgi:Rap guanine nucleotide exchange factor 4